MPSRVLVIGLDCAPPSLVFERYRSAMPTLSGLMERGSFGPMRSTIPPITVPAWTSMVSGRDPGELGLYGFRNRAAGGYALETASSKDVRVKRVWDYVGESGRRAAALFVPLTSPPSPIRGAMISCFMRAGPEAPFAFPRKLEGVLESRFGPYLSDVERFRSDEHERILRELHAMADQHFAMARFVWEEERPDFLMMVEMGPDRLHHALWHVIDPAHPRYDPEGPWAAAARRYYARLDEHIGALVSAAGEETTVIVVSDHGARSMVGGIRINEWLRRGGWLVLEEEPSPGTPFSAAKVDWSRTRAFSEGGYYARVFLNLEGRDPRGCVAPERYDEVRAELARALEVMPGPDGRPLGTRILFPERVYRKVRGFAPDLMVFFGDLAWRSIGTVGEGSLYAEHNDTGPDGCNHDWEGVFIMAGGGAPARGCVEGIQIYDVTATVLGLFGIESPPDLLGRDWSRTQ